MIAMEAWIQILNNVIAKFGSKLPDEAIEQLQRIRDEMELNEARAQEIHPVPNFDSYVKAAKKMTDFGSFVDNQTKRMHISTLED